MVNTPRFGQVGQLLATVAALSTDHPQPVGGDTPFIWGKGDQIYAEGEGMPTGDPLAEAEAQTAEMELRVTAEKLAERKAAISAAIRAWNELTAQNGWQHRAGTNIVARDTLRLTIAANAPCSAALTSASTQDPSGSFTRNTDGTLTAGWTSPGETPVVLALADVEIPEGLVDTVNTICTRFKVFLAQ